MNAPALWAAPKHSESSESLSGTVHISSKVHLTHPKVRLGELAQLKGFEPLDRARLAQLSFMSAPEVGSSLQLKRSALKAKLSKAIESQLPELSARYTIRFKLPARLTLDREATTLSPARLSQYLKDAALALGPFEGLRLGEVTLPRLSPLKVPAGATLKLNVGAGSIPTRVPVDLLLEREGRLLRRQRLFVQVDHLQDVVVLTRQLPVGTLLSAADMTLSPVSARLLPPGALTNPSDLIGAKLRQSLGPKIPLRKAWLWVPPLIKRGAQVLMLFKRGTLTISAQGKALGDGAKGDMIKVRNSQSKKLVMGRVVAPNQVEVEF